MNKKNYSSKTVTHVSHLNMFIHVMRVAISISNYFQIKCCMPAFKLIMICLLAIASYSAFSSFSLLVVLF